MTKKADFNAEEWSLVLEGPPVAGMIVIVADRGGTIRESMSLARAYQEAQRENGTELVKEIVSARPEFNPKQYENPEQLREKGMRRISEAVNLLEQKATSDEVEEYKKFVLDVADTVAHAKKEGGVLGIGGKPVSDQEQAAIDEIGRALRTGP